MIIKTQPKRGRDGEAFTKKPKNVGFFPAGMGVVRPPAVIAKNNGWVYIGGECRSPKWDSNKRSLAIRNHVAEERK